MHFPKFFGKVGVIIHIFVTFFPSHLRRKNCSNGFIMNIMMKYFQATGANCICHNNTMSNVDKCTRRSFRDGTCHMKQCSKCTEYYLGFPEKGNTKFCFH